MLTPHSDPDDMESIALLDRTDQRLSQAQNSKRDKRKFDKIITKKDNELREIMEKVQKQSQALDEVKAVMRTPPSLLGPRPPAHKCGSWTPSWLTMVVAALVLVIGLSVLIYIQSTQNTNN